MKAPICDICLRSSILCSGCKRLIDEGKITVPDINVSRKIFEVSERFKSPKTVTIKRVIETDNNILIVPVEGDASKIIGKEGLIVRELSRIMGKNVRVIEETRDKREFIERIVFPAKVSGMNVLYTEDGEVLKVVLNRKPGISEENLREIMKEVHGDNVRIVSE
jgi:transcription antitermination factor NusA-like protein